MKKNYGWKMMAAMMVLAAGTMMIGADDAYAKTVREGDCGEQIHWTLDDKGCMTISGNGAMFEGCGEDEAVAADVQQDVKRVVVESGVTDVANYAFYGCTNLESVVLPEGITRIGCSAFQNCESLTSVSMEDGIGYIGSSAFENCYQLTSIDLPVGLESITYYMFRNSGLKSITIPEGVVSIEACAFRSCFNLTSVYLPASIENIHEYAFRLCENLTNIVYGKEQSEEITADAPAAPLELAAPVLTDVSNTRTGIRVTWDAVENAQEYRVYRRTADETSYKRVRTTAGTTFLNTSVADGVTYCYKVRAVVTSEDGTVTMSPYSKMKTCRRVNQPTLVSVAAGSTAGSIVVKWNGDATAESYKIRYSTDKDFTTYREVTASGSSSSKKVTGLKSGKRYYVRVIAAAVTYTGKTCRSAVSTWKSAVAK